MDLEAHLQMKMMPMLKKVTQVQSLRKILGIITKNQLLGNGIKKAKANSTMEQKKINFL